MHTVSKSTVILILASVITGLPGTLLAEGWKGEGELGFSATSGNTDTQNLATKLTLSREIEQWRHIASLEALQAESSGTTTAERYVLAGKSDYKFSEKMYAFGALRYEVDEFSSFESQTVFTAGIGARLLEDDVRSLDVSAGAGLRQSEVRSAGESLEDGIIRLAGQYQHKFNESVAFSQELLVESGEENTYIESITGLTSKVSDNLAAKISYVIKRNSDVTAGLENTDTLTTASLVYSF